MGTVQNHQKNGFTIVELLIVVVVIAILAAITIVAYNGIQNRAKASAAQSLTSQTAKKVALYAVDNGDQYPATLELAGVTNTTGLQYSSSGSTFCITGTSQNVSYFQSHSSSNVTAGACPGHGANGVTPITNHAQNPTFTTIFGVYASTSGGQASTNSNPSTGAPNGGYFLRRTYSAPTTTFAAGGDIFTVGSSTWTGNSANGSVAATPGQVFTGSMYVRSSKAQAVRVQLQWLTTSNSSAGSNDGSTTVLTPNTWTRISASGTAPSNTVALRLDIDAGTGAIQWATNDTLDITMLMISEGTTLYTYADGSSAGWAWSGTANNSKSTGPAL